MTLESGPATKTIPGPSGLPLLGVMPEMVSDMLGLFTKTARNHGGIAQFKLLGKPYLLVTDPDYVKYILQDNHHNYIRGRSVETGRVLLGNGLPLTDGDFWLRERRLLQPAFHRERLEGLTTTAGQIIDTFLQTWTEKARSNRMIDMDDEMMNLTLTVIIKSMFSADIDDKIHSLSRAFNVASKFMLWRSQQMWAPPLSVPVPRNVEYNRALKVLNETIYPLIADARMNPKDDLLGMMLEMRDAETGEGMTDQQARDEVVTIFFAGHETTAATMTWAFYSLWRHPEVEGRLREEIKSVLDGRMPKFADLSKLTYMQMVVNEILRLYPAAYLFAREAVTDDVIDGYPIPTGNLIFITPFITHRDPKYWPDPEKFDPERFTPENTGSRPKHVYYPFGEGPHVCIGNNFAVMEMQLILAAVLQRYKLTLDPMQKIAFKPEATLRPRYGMKFKVEMI
ncbi:MAG TPA: cytochrome P450 [Anaerolineales bacterium]|nr:cytochrome P450 [Anaerolineales bacterium]